MSCVPPGGKGLCLSCRFRCGCWSAAPTSWSRTPSGYIAISIPFGVLLLVMVLVTATSNLAAAMPASVGGIGPFEIVTQQTLLVLGVGAAVGAVYAGFVHLVALWLPVNLVGLVLLWRQHLSLGPMLRSPVEGGSEPVSGYGPVASHSANEEAP